MEENRKKSIDNLVSELKSDYDVKSLDGLKQLARDKEICVIESDEVVLPSALKIKEQRYILLNQNYLGKKFTLIHEIGHHLLEHFENKNPLEETEANYFSKQLLDKQAPYFEVFINCLYFLSNKPLLTLKCVFFSYLDNKNALNIIKNYEQQNGKI